MAANLKFTTRFFSIAFSKKDFPVYYLLGFEKDETYFCNYLQEGLDIAIEQAFDDFGVPEDSWVEMAEGERSLTNE